MPETVGYDRSGKIRKTLSKDLQTKMDRARERLLFGQHYRQSRREHAWREAYNQYMDKIGWDRRDDLTADLVSVNISFSTVNTLVPFVADENPHFLVEPYSGEANFETGKLLEAFLNRLWESDQLDGQIHLSAAAVDNLIYGDGFVKVLWEIVDKPIYDARGDVLEGRGSEVAEFSLERINPWDLWIDPYSDGIYNARWVCQRVVLPVSELKKDSRYKVIDDIQGGDPNFGGSEQQQDRINFGGQDGWVSVFEFYDLKERWMLAFTLESELPLRYIENISVPIVQFGNYRIPNSPYHMGDMEQIRSLQEELNKTRSQMITHRRRNVMKWIVRMDLLDDQGIQAMKSSIVNDVIPVVGPEPFERILSPVTPQPLSADSYLLDDRIKNDINEITGVNEYLRGVPPEIRRTATEASIIEGATNVRTRHKLLQIERAARQIGQLLLDIIFDVLPLTDFEEMKMFITGSEAERLNRVLGNANVNTDLIFTPTPETFQGVYQVFVERGSSELRNPVLKEQKFKEMSQILIQAAPILAQLGVVVNVRKALEMWFEAAGVDDVDAMFEADPEQQALMEQQAMMQAMGQGQGLPSGDEPTGMRPNAGEPNQRGTNVPTSLIGPENSGQFPPR